MKRVPNIITVLRILAATVLFFLNPFQLPFLILYLFCGISDIADGYLARKWNATSKLGAMLDSIADFIFVIVLLSVVVSVMRLSPSLILLIAVVGGIRVVSLLLGFIKFKTFVFLHTYANKVTGFLLFCLPLLLRVMPISILLIGIGTVAILSAVEELLLQLMAKELERDKKGIFF